jgi:hypothetical protein
MKLWAIQSGAQWREIQDFGVLHNRYPPSEERAPDCAYLWMTQQMRRRVGPSPPGVELPLWTWQQWLGAARVRPDLRQVARWYPRGERHVRLEFEVPDDQVLLFSYDLWSAVLVGCYIAPTQEETDRWEQWEDWPKNPPDMPTIEESWDRCFDLDWLLRHEYWHCGDTLKTLAIQACVWEIRREQVIAVTEFVGRRVS